MDPQRSPQNANNNTPASCTEGSDAARSAPKQGQSATPSSPPTAAVSANPHRPFQPEEYRRFKSKFLDYLQDRKLPIRITGLAGSLPLLTHICMINHWIEERHLQHPDEAIMPILIGWIGPTAITQSDLERHIQRHSPLTAKPSSAAAAPHRPPFRPAHNIKIDHQEHRLFEQIKQLKAQHPNTFFLLSGEHNTNISGEYWTSPERSDASGGGTSKTLAPPSSACYQEKTHLRGNEMYNRISDTLRQFGLDMDTVVEGTTLRAVDRQAQSSSHVYKSWMHDFKLHMILDKMAHDIIAAIQCEDPSTLTNTSITNAISKAMLNLAQTTCQLQYQQWLSVSTSEGRIYYCQPLSNNQDLSSNKEDQVNRVIQDMQAAGQSNISENQQTTCIDAFDFHFTNMDRFQQYLLDYASDPQYVAKTQSVSVPFFPQTLISDPFAGYPKKWNFFKSQESDDTHVLFHNVAQHASALKESDIRSTPLFDIPYAIDDNLFYLRLAYLLKFTLEHPDYPLYLKCNGHSAVAEKRKKGYSMEKRDQGYTKASLPYPELAPKNIDLIQDPVTLRTYHQTCWNTFDVGHLIYQFFDKGAYSREHPQYAVARELLSHYINFVEVFNKMPEPCREQVPEFVLVMQQEFQKRFPKHLLDHFNEHAIIYPAVNSSIVNVSLFKLTGTGSERKEKNQNQSCNNRQ